MAMWPHLKTPKYKVPISFAIHFVLKRQFRKCFQVFFITIYIKNDKKYLKSRCLIDLMRKDSIFFAWFVNDNIYYYFDLSRSLCVSHGKETRRRRKKKNVAHTHTHIITYSTQHFKQIFQYSQFVKSRNIEKR